MKCPKCQKVEMSSESHEGITIDRCPVCKGISLDKGELESLLGKELGNQADNLSSTATSDAMDTAPAYCFKCKKEMMPLTGAADIRFEWCETCESIFLDKGELATLQIFEAD
jgi:Zn-finger nucleic acid-binding protein